METRNELIDFDAILDATLASLEYEIKNNGVPLLNDTPFFYYFLRFLFFLHYFLITSCQERHFLFCHFCSILSEITKQTKIWQPITTRKRL